MQDDDMLHNTTNQTVEVTQSDQEQTTKAISDKTDSGNVDSLKKDHEYSGLELLLIENNKLLKQQILTTRILTGFVGILIISLFVGGGIVANKLKGFNQILNGIDAMTQNVAELDVDKFNQTIKEFGEKVSKLDIDGLNDTIDTLNSMAAKVDEVNRDLENFTSQFGFLFGS